MRTCCYRRETFSWKWNLSQEFIVRQISVLFFSDRWLNRRKYWISKSSLESFLPPRLIFVWEVGVLGKRLWSFHMWTPVTQHLQTVPFPVVSTVMVHKLIWQSFYINILHDTSGIFVNYNFSQIEKDTGSYKGLNDNGTKRGWELIRAMFVCWRKSETKSN